jgi:hypothetical protein
MKLVVSLTGIVKSQIRCSTSCCFIILLSLELYEELGELSRTDITRKHRVKHVQPLRCVNKDKGVNFLRNTIFATLAQADLKHDACED